jgi:hypothetical protein
MSTDHVIGLDLGQSSDFTALAVAERTYPPGAARHTLTVNYLRRWPLGTAYPAIVADVAALVQRRPLDWPGLAVDETGVGRAVVDLFRQAQLEARLHPVWITGGHATSAADGTWHVPKKELVSTLQALLQSDRLRIASLPERELLVQELLAFRVKVTAGGTETFEAWREKDHDDLVLAVALAAWLAERWHPFVAPCLSDLPPRSQLVEFRVREPSRVYARGLFGMTGR